MNPVRERPEEGVALVITLAIVVIATILVVGFATSMRTERQASASMANNEISGLLAQTAVAHAISILDKNIPQPVPPGASTSNPTNWITNPGLLTTIQGTSAPVQIPLSSDPSPGYAATNQDAELNIPQLSGSGFTILPTSAPMRVAWVPVLKSPGQASGLSNQITGRYGFWVDDESAKINLNTAYGKPASLDFTKLTPGTITVGAETFPLGHPSSVNLNVLGNNIDLPGLATAVDRRSGLSSIDDIQAQITGGGSRAFLDANKFFLTAFSRDPEFNVFGKSRIYLFKQINGGNFTRQLGHPLFQVFRDVDAPMYFHGDEAPLADTEATYYTAANIAAVLNRNDWPGMPARSFIQKWGGAPPGTPDTSKTPAQLTADREADQVAWNMVSLGTFSDYGVTYTPLTSGDYVNFENKIATGQPGNTGTVNYPNAALPIGPLSKKAIVPAFPRPLINEVCLTMTFEPNVVGGITKYRLKVWLQTELWLGPGYPACDFSGTAEEVGLTYLSYSVTQGNNTVSQEDTKYIKSSDPDGIRSMFGSITNGALPAGSSRYAVVVTQGAPGQPVQTNKWIYVRNGSGFSSSTVGPFNFEPQGSLHVDFKMRLFEHSPAGSTPTAPPCSLVPVWDRRDPQTSATNGWNPTPPATPLVPALAPPQGDQDYIEFSFDLSDPVSLASQQITRSLEVVDPRLGGLSTQWTKAQGFDDSANPSADTLGAPNSATLANGWDTNKLAFVDFSNPTGTSNAQSYRPPIGMFSVIPTGMQRGIPGSTLKLQPSGSATDLPDWLLLNLLAPSAEAIDYPDLSVMNSTAGKVNLNASIYPSSASFAPPQRWQPLQAVFQNMAPAATVPTGATAPSTVVTSVLNHSLATGGIDFGAPGQYDYLGEVCEIAGVADTGATDWDKEEIVRYIASNLTTRSNVFSVWGVAQTVKKNPANVDPAKQGIFETKATGATGDDTITGERRFEAVVERYIWPGNDAIAGNGHVGPTGAYDKLNGQTKPGLAPGYAPPANWEEIDGPESPSYPVNAASGPWNANVGASYSTSTIEDANNPLRASAKFRVIYFKYLTE